jgi:chorismate mutase
MVTLAEMLEQRAKLDEQIAEAKKTERKAAVDDVREKCKAYEITLWDLRGALASSNYQQMREDAFLEKLASEKAAKKEKK